MYVEVFGVCFFFSSRRRHTRYWRDWSSDVCSSDLTGGAGPGWRTRARRLPRRPADRCIGTIHRQVYGRTTRADRKSVVEGKSVDLGGRRIIKKKINGGQRDTDSDHSTTAQINIDTA